MALSTTDTTITYPDGATTSTGTVLHVEPLSDGRSAVLLDSTAFHPVDTAWPDQPADRGTITTTAGTQPIIDGVTGGIRNGALHLDAALSTAWSKPAPTDALGNPAFDALAIQRSRIDPHRSTDTYRIGKSLRRKGFAPASLDDPSAAAERVNAQLAQWIKAGGAVRIERDDTALSARRTWVCALPNGVTDIPCGGTHLHDLAELSNITTSLTTAEIDGGLELVMETVATTT